MKAILVITLLIGTGSSFTSKASLDVKPEIYNEVSVITEAKIIVDKIELLKAKTKNAYTLQDLTVAQNELLEEMNEHILYVNMNSIFKIKLIDAKATFQIAKQNTPL